jgi:predicted solute-binding protein
MESFDTLQVSSSSTEARVLIDPVFASSGVIASSPNRSLNGVKPVDLETVVLWFHTTLMDIVFAQQAKTKVSPIEKPRVLEFLRPALTRSGTMEELKKYINSIFMVPNLLISSYSNVIGLTLKKRDEHILILGKSKFVRIPS